MSSRALLVQRYGGRHDRNPLVPQRERKLDDRRRLEFGQRSGNRDDVFIGISGVTVTSSSDVTVKSIGVGNSELVISGSSTFSATNGTGPNEITGTIKVNNGSALEFVGGTVENLGGTIEMIQPKQKPISTLPITSCWREAATSSCQRMQTTTFSAKPAVPY